MIEIKNIILSTSKNSEFVVDDVFELKKLPNEFGTPPAEIGHYPYELKYWVNEVTENKFHLGSFSVSMDSKPKIEDYQLFPIPKNLGQADANHFRLRELLYLLNLQSDHHFFQYSCQQSWFVEVGNFSESKWGQSMFFTNRELGEPTTQSNGVNESDRPILKLTNETTGEVFSPTFSEFVKMYLAQEQGELKTLMHQAMRTFSKSLAVQAVDWNASYLFFYSVLESLAEYEFKSKENKKCNECGQMVYSVSKKLKALLDAYCYEISNKEKNKLYELRSKIVHNGKMLPFTNDHKWVMETQEDLDAFYYSNLSRQYFDWLKRITQLTAKSFMYQKMAAPNKT